MQNNKYIAENKYRQKSHQLYFFFFDVSSFPPTTGIVACCPILQAQHGTSLCRASPHPSMWRYLHCLIFSPTRECNSVFQSCHISCFLQENTVSDNHNTVYETTNKTQEVLSVSSN